EKLSIFGKDNSLTMKKTFYIFSFIFLSVIFYGCDKEPVDEVVKDDYLKGEAIVRFDLNGVTYGARHNDVSVVYNDNGSLTIAVNAKDEDNDFNRINFGISISSAEKGFYPTGYDFTLEQFAFSTMKLIDVPHFYMSIPNKFMLDIDNGSLTITEVNEFAKQSEGHFSFELVLQIPDEITDLSDVPYPMTQKIENGYFKYISYED